MSYLEDKGVYVGDKKTHDSLFRAYIEEKYANKDIYVDWEWSGPGRYRIHVHEVNGRVSISFKWEGI